MDFLKAPCGKILLVISDCVFRRKPPTLYELDPLSIPRDL